MSEYQYYEFQALDQPLTAEAQQAVHRLSSRVHLTPSSASFVYNHGDFRGNRYDVLAKYFDVMLYITNWGTRQLMFRFPRQTIPLHVRTQYRYDDSLEWSSVGDYTILNIEYHDESGDWGWVEGEGLLPGIVPVRNDILRGDWRALYLAWLLFAREEFEILEADEDLTSPPLPPNLHRLSPALERFATFFDLDPDLITAAAQFSRAIEPSENDLSAQLDRLPDGEKQDFLRRLLRGESHLDIALAARLRELAGPDERATVTEPTCSIQQLVAGARQIAQQRREAEREQAEIERLKKLEETVRHEGELWARLADLIEQKKANAYEEAIDILKALRDLAIYQNRSSEFRQKMVAIKNQHPTLQGLLKRMKNAGLI